MSANHAQGYIVGELADSGENDWMAKQWTSLGYPNSTYNADMLSVDVFSIGANSAYVQPLHQLLAPALFRGLPSASAGGAKAALSQLKGSRLDVAKVRRMVAERNATPSFRK